MQQMTKKQLQQELTRLTNEKNELLKLKNSKKDGFSKEDQERLNEIAETIVDIEEQLENSDSEEAKFDVPKGTENMVHAMIVYGDRYDSKTGKEIVKPSKQMFTPGEWQLFKKNHKALGYTIAEVLYNPFEKINKNNK